MWIISFSFFVVLIILGITIGTTISLKKKGNTPETVVRTTTTTIPTTITTTIPTTIPTTITATIPTTIPTTTSESKTGIFLWNKM